VKNAAEAVQGYVEAGETDAQFQGRVDISLKVDDGWAVVEVHDNGTGLSKQHRARLLEPYVTTKSKGTGLGLAIVKKVIEQHGGSLRLEDTPLAGGHGALVRVRLPLHEADAQQPARTPEVMEQNS